MQGNATWTQISYILFTTHAHNLHKCHRRICGARSPDIPVHKAQVHFDPPVLEKFDVNLYHETSQSGRQNIVIISGSQASSCKDMF